jgi:hypothetical protein
VYKRLRKGIENNLRHRNNIRKHNSRSNNSLFKKKIPERVELEGCCIDFTFRTRSSRTLFRIARFVKQSERNINSPDEGKTSSQEPKCH